jgi:phosphinothricin acetyltransferase
MTIRPALECDIPAITAIYAPHVLHGTATFEVEAPDCDEILRRWTEVCSANLPYLVAEVEGSVAGYAYATPYRPRLAYRYTVEDSVYIHPDHLGKGLGRSLLRQLIVECEESGCRQMIAVIGDSANRASIRLHESLGFIHNGTFRSVGWKFDRWLDTVLMQRALGEGDSTLPSGV